MATPHYYAAIDLGATSGRVILGEWTNNKLTLNEAHRFPNHFESVSGHDYWNIGSLWKEVLIGIKKATDLLPKNAKLNSLGVDTWGVDYVLLNDLGRLVFPVHAYRDLRTQVGLKRLINTRAEASRIFAATGVPPVFYNTSLQLEETIKSCPSITDLATRCLFLSDYFNYLLSGRMENEFSISSTSQLLDVNTHDWSRTALDYFRVPTLWFKKPVVSGTHLGLLNKEIRALSSKLQKTKVIAVPGHDTACAYDAMPADPDGGDLYISSGTWSLVGFESKTPLLGNDAIEARLSNERRGDGSYRPLKNVIGLWLLEGVMKDFRTRPNSDSDWAKLIKSAEKLSTPKNLLDVGDPNFTHPISMKEAIDNHLKRRKISPPKNLVGYTRLICDSLGKGHGDAKTLFEKLTGRKFKRILMVGGGSRNKLLCQATANFAGIPVVSFNLEGTAVGNIASQLIASKTVKDLATFRNLLNASLDKKTYLPLI
jgi:rhamnulokinase